jgi:hypothetical protein
MWIGNGPFNSYGYQKDAYVKGEAEYILPTRTYQIQDRGSPNSAEQYWVVPVDQNGNQIGPEAFKTAGSVMYGYWNEWNISNKVEISNFFPG